VRTYETKQFLHASSFDLSKFNKEREGKDTMKNAAVALLRVTSGGSRGFMKQTDIHRYIQTLRLRLLDMSRVSQRAVDYSIKAYKLNCPEFCANVRDSTYEVNILHREITEIARDLLLMELPLESDVRFALSAIPICDALHSVHAQAIKIAANSARLLENGRMPGWAALTRMGEIVNSLMKLCIIALFNEEVAHAETVLTNSGFERFFESAFYDWYRNVDQRLRTQASHELAITKGLSQMAKETYEIADAIVFWLKGPDSGSTSPIDREQPTIHIVPVREVEGVTRDPDGMQAVLEKIDACFADSSFWSRL
jgi:phosphate transport system protein